MKEAMSLGVRVQLRSPCVSTRSELIIVLAPSRAGLMSATSMSGSTGDHGDLQLGAVQREEQSLELRAERVLVDGGARLFFGYRDLVRRR